ncbi:MAG: DUF3368 domain-containing protein [bacterium]
MKIVTNATILIGLSKIKRFNLLKEIFKEVIIPESIYNEVIIEGVGKLGSEETKNADWIKVQSVKNFSLKEDLLVILGEGEAEVITLAIEINADILLLDELSARKIAGLKGLKVMGLIGILIEAKQRGIIQSVKDEWNKLIKEGMYYSTVFYEEVLKRIEEWE